MVQTTSRLAPVEFEQKVTMGSLRGSLLPSTQDGNPFKSACGVRKFHPDQILDGLFVVRPNVYVSGWFSHTCTSSAGRTRSPSHMNRPVGLLHAQRQYDAQHIVFGSPRGDETVRSVTGGSVTSPTARRGSTMPTDLADSPLSSAGLETPMELTL